MNKKLETELETSTIKQTRDETVEASPIGSASPGSRVKIGPIRFKQEAINKVRKENHYLLMNFGDIFAFFLKNRNFTIKIVFMCKYI